MTKPQSVEDIDIALISHEKAIKALIELGDDLLRLRDKKVKKELKETVSDIQ